MNNSNDNFYFLGFSNFTGIGVKRMKWLLDYFGTVKNAWFANFTDLQAAGLTDNLIKKFFSFRDFFSFPAYLEKLKSEKIYFITINDDLYPENLKQIPDPPFVLYLKGNLEILNRTLTIGIVGTRKITRYGENVTRLFSQKLSDKGFVIVSGMAIGVDSLAHLTALENNGLTIAVLGSGVDICTPLENKFLYDQILENGLILSNFKPGTKSSVGTFPARNKIIAGLSLGILVTEGAEDSGALITADFALKFNRKIFAIPGPITSVYSKGTNKLIKNGAIPIIDVEDVIDKLPISKIADQIGNGNKELKIINLKNTENFSKAEKEIIDLLNYSSLHFDEIVRKIGKSAKEIGSLLSTLEIKGSIKNAGGEYNIV